MLNRMIFLMGMPGSGKSTLGRQAAGEAGVPFLDLDDWIAERAGRAVREIFGKYGEEGFRRMETNALVWLTAQRPMVIALGGGTAMDPVNRKILRGFGSAILLDRPVELILTDLRTEDRPLLTENAEEKMWALYDQRMPVYRRLADVTVRNDGSARNAVTLLVRVLKERYHA